MAFKRSKKSEVTPRRRQLDESSADYSDRSSSQRTQYNRNRTLSGYRRDTTAPDESSRHKVHALASQRRRVGGIFLIVSIATVFLGLLLWQLIAQVHIVSSTKALTTQFEAAPYETSINEYLAVNPAQRLRFALDPAALSAFVTNQYPEVEELNLTGAPGVAQSNFAITFRTPVAGWQINDTQYYVDSNGVVFQKNYYDTPGVQIVDESGVNPEQGSAVVGTRLLGFLGKIVAEAEGRGLTVVKAALPAGKTRELDVYVASSPTRIKFSIDRGAGEQSEDMARALQFLSARGIVPSYIDVRISGRAAYQ